MLGDLPTTLRGMIQALWFVVSLSPLLLLAELLVAVAAEVMMDPLSRVVVIMVVTTFWLVSDVTEVVSDEVVVVGWVVVVVGSVLVGVVVVGSVVVVSPLVVVWEVVVSSDVVVEEDALGSSAVVDDPSGSVVVLDPPGTSAVLLREMPTPPSVSFDCRLKRSGCCCDGISCRCRMT